MDTWKRMVEMKTFLQGEMLCNLYAKRFPFWWAGTRRLSVQEPSL
jgi:hypothetical protein